MTVNDDQYLIQPNPSADDGHEPDHPFEQETNGECPYPQTFHPNILPPTEFMALGMYAV